MWLREGSTVECLRLQMRVARICVARKALPPSSNASQVWWQAHYHSQVEFLSSQSYHYQPYTGDNLVLGSIWDFQPTTLVLDHKILDTSTIRPLTSEILCHWYSMFWIWDIYPIVLLTINEKKTNSKDKNLNYVYSMTFLKLLKIKIK